MILSLILRLILFLTAMALPWYHPGVVITYDIYGFGLFFLLIPIQALTGFYLTARGRPWKRAVIAAILLQAGMSLIFAGSGDLILFTGAGIWSFLSTIFIFRYRWRWAAVPEIVYLAAVYLRLINFTRGISPEIAASSLPQTLMFIGIAALAGHFLVTMRALRAPGKRKGEIREVLLLAGVGIPLVLAAILLVPPDFVSHNMVFNQLFEPPRPEPKPLNGNGSPGGGLEGDPELGRRRMQNGEPGLYGLPADQWGEAGRRGQGEGDGTGGNQYAVLVVASPLTETYLAEGYYSHFDPVQGFEMEQDYPLNRIVSRRLLETWNNTEVPRDSARSSTDIFVVSTIADRLMAYLPLSAEPTIYDRSVFPFTYSYPSISAVSVADPYQWFNARDYTPREKAELSDYLSINLDKTAENSFRNYLNSVLQPDMGPGEKVIEILRGFSKYQYEIGFEEDVSVEAMRYFLDISRSGDCTEFSNTAAILGRLAGIPSRVVTGYLASEGLQTFSHLQGLYMLQQNIPLLQQFDLGELFLVTSAHRHSWTQFYLPDYGWIDFETTQFAIPPEAGGDPNSQDVVIPLIEDRTVKGRAFSIPWKMLGQSAMLLIVLLTVGIYTYRYGRELYLRRIMQKDGREGLLAAEKLLVSLLANEGIPLKKKSETPGEYTREVPELAEFARLYQELRFRERLDDESRREMKQQLIEELHRVSAGRRRKGLPGAFMRVFTLKGIRGT